MNRKSPSMGNTSKKPNLQRNSPTPTKKELPTLAKHTLPHKPAKILKSVTQTREYAMPADELWSKISSPDQLSKFIPMLSSWTADGELCKGQTGKEVHEFFPGLAIEYTWHMVHFVPQKRWAMMSKPSTETIFNLPHYTDYQVEPRENGSALTIKFTAQALGIFSLPGASHLLEIVMRKTVRDLLRAIE